MQKKGFLFVLGTALISGFSIFLNAFAVKGFNPFVFTAMKNLFVGLAFVSLLFLLKDFKQFKKLSFASWKNLFLIGLLGGSIPFLLWFYAIKQASSGIGLGFIHKTLFVFVSFIAFFYLKESFNKKFLLASFLLLFGNYFLFSNLSFGFPELLGLIAVLFWAIETNISKKMLFSLPATMIASARMFFGAMFMLAFLIATNQFAEIFVMSSEQWLWILLTSVLLFGYVATYYSGLKLIPASRASAVLLLGQPVTGVLSAIFLGKTITLEQATGFTLIIAGVFVMVYSTISFSYILGKGLSFEKRSVKRN